MNIAQELLSDANNNPDSLTCVITYNQTLLYCNDVETKDQTYQWKRQEYQGGKNTSNSVECEGFAHCL